MLPWATSGTPATLEEGVERARRREAARQQRHERSRRLAPHEEWVLGSPERERGVLLDAAGRELTRKEGSRGEVLWPEDELLSFHGRIDILTHNHPSRWPLGHDDLITAMKLNAREVNAVTPQMRYRLARLTDRWPERELRAAVEAEMNAMVDEVVQALEAGRATEEEVKLAFYDELWRRMARRFPDRLLYEVERRT